MHFGRIFFLLEKLIILNGRGKIKTFVQPNLSFVKFMCICLKTYENIGYGLWNYRVIVVFVLFFYFFQVFFNENIPLLWKKKLKYRWGPFEPSGVLPFLYAVLIFYTHITGLLGMNWRSPLEWFSQLTYSLTAVVSYMCWTKDLE